MFLWNALTGQRVGSFAHAHDSALLTAATFDAGERRLVTAGGDGSVHVWSKCPPHLAGLSTERDRCLYILVISGK